MDRAEFQPGRMLNTEHWNLTAKGRGKSEKWEFLSEIFITLLIT